jgi:hypothetical protein
MMDRDIFREKYPGYTETGIVQARVNCEKGVWDLAEDRYVMFSNRDGKVVNVREVRGRILEVYPGDYRLNWKNPSGVWNHQYGFSPAALTFPRLDPIDYYLTCEGVDPRYADFEFFERYRYVTPRWDAHTMKVTMVYGSNTPEFETADAATDELFGRFPATTFLSVYYRPGDLKRPRAALVRLE